MNIEWCWNNRHRKQTLSGRGKKVSCSTKLKEPIAHSSSSFIFFLPVCIYRYFRRNSFHINGPTDFTLLLRLLSELHIVSEVRDDMLPSVNPFPPCWHTLSVREDSITTSSLKGRLLSSECSSLLPSPCMNETVGKRKLMKSICHHFYLDKQLFLIIIKI